MSAPGEPAVSVAAKASPDRVRAVAPDLPIVHRKGISHYLTYLLGALVVVMLVKFLALNPNWQWDVVGEWLFSERVMAGLVNTLILTVSSSVIGLMLGVVTAACRLSQYFVLRAIASAYIWVTRATPGLVLILLVYFFAALVPTLNIGIPFMNPIAEIPTNAIVSQFSAAVIGLSLYLGAYSAETFRGGVLAVPRGQFEACHSLGLSTWTTYRKVVGPQLIRVIIPPLANELVTMFKNTSLVSVIGYTELLTTVQLIYSQNLQTVPLLMVAVLWYLVLTSLAMIGQSFLERRFGRGFDRRIMPEAMDSRSQL